MPCRRWPAGRQRRGRAAPPRRRDARGVLRSVRSRRGAVRRVAVGGRRAPPRPRRAAGIRLLPVAQRCEGRRHRQRLRARGSLRRRRLHASRVRRLPSRHQVHGAGAAGVLPGARAAAGREDRALRGDAPLRPGLGLVDRRPRHWRAAHGETSCSRAGAARGAAAAPDNVPPAQYINASATFAWPNEYAPGTLSTAFPRSFSGARAPLPPKFDGCPAGRSCTTRPTGLIDRSLDVIEALEKKGGEARLVLTTWAYIIYTYLECQGEAMYGFVCPGAARKKRLEDAIRAGKITWFCNPLNSEDGTYSAGSLGAGIDVSNALRTKYGRAPCRSVGREDDPGASRGAIPVMANRSVLGYATCCATCCAACVCCLLQTLMLSWTRIGSTSATTTGR